MAMTLLESAKYGDDYLRQGVIKTIAEATPIMELISFDPIRGNAYRYNREAALPGVGYRAVNAVWTRTTGIINPVTEHLVILGGEIFIDNFQVNTQGNRIDIKATQFSMFARAMGIQFSESFLEGDSAVDANEFDGLRKRIAGNQLINAATGGATLTLAMLDELIDSVIGDEGQKMLLMNKTLRRKVTSLARAQTGTVRITEDRDNFGRQFMKYAGVRIGVIERTDDASTYLAFDEDDGSGNADSASIYCVNLNSQYIVGLKGEGGGDFDVKDFGEIETEPGHLGRAEAYVGLAILHPRAAARLYHLNNA